jgi:hypothetical protein
MLTLVSNNSFASHHTDSLEYTQSGEELLMEYLIWQTQFDQDPSEIFEDSVALFMATSRKEPLKLV